MQQGLRQPRSLDANAYLLALATVAAFVGAQHLLSPVIARHAPLGLLSLAVIISAWAGGRGPGLFATVLAAALGNFFFLEPYRSFVVEHEADLVRLGAFTVEGCLLTWLAWTLRRRGRFAAQWLAQSPVVAVLLGVAALVPLVAWAVVVLEADVPGATIRTYGDALWWAGATTLRMGYGDNMPMSDGGRVLAVVLMVASFAGLATAGGKAAAVVVAKRARAAMPQIRRVEPSLAGHELVGHVVICGWRTGAERDLLALVDDGVPPTSIYVLTTSVPKRAPLGGIVWLDADPSDERSLKAVNARAASRILLLGDGPAADAACLKTALHLAKMGTTADIQADVGSDTIVPYLHEAGVRSVVVRS